MHQRLSRESVRLRLGLRVDRRCEYARRARQILVGYAERYAKYPYHSANMGKLTDAPSKSGGHVFEQTLNEASWIGSVAKPTT